MDNYLNKNRFIAYYRSMANPEANRLRTEARYAAFRHLKTLPARARFSNNIEAFITAQLRGIATAKNDAEGKRCFTNLQMERHYIREQDIALKTGKAKLYASAELKNTLDGWGYVINGVGVVLSGFQIAAGAGIIIPSALTGNVVGISGGILLILHGANGMQESITNIVQGKNNTTGFIKNRYVVVANFLGFDSKAGILLYSAADLSLSAYGMMRFITKPDAWRLFKSIPSDFVRNYKTMSTTSLTLEVVSDSLSIYSGYSNGIKKN